MVKEIENRSATSGSAKLYADLRNYLDVLSGERHRILVSCRIQDVEGDLGLDFSCGGEAP